MKAETKAIIVFVVLILSAGPLTYFFSKEPEEIDLDGGDAVSQFITGSSIFLTNIESIQPAISYVGVSSSNDEKFVRQRIDAIEEIGNYTLSMGLSTRGGGYEYIINVQLGEMDKTEEDMKRRLIGFKLMYWLSDFFNPEYSISPFSGGTLLLPEQIGISVGNETVPVETDEDQRANAYLLYWQKAANPVTVQCSEVTASNTGKLIKITQPCFDSTETYLYGLPESYFKNTKIERQKTMSISLREFNEVQFRGKVTGNISQQEVKEALSSYFEESEIAIQTDTTDMTFLLAIPYEDADTSYSVADILHDVEGIKIEEQYNLATADLPNSVNLDGKEYDLTIARNAYVRTPLNTQLGAVTADLSFHTLLGEVVGVEGEAA